jgi:dihydroneopterin aldolase
MAESIAGLCLADPRVRAARVRVEKLDVFPEAASVGVEIERVRKAP